MFDPVNPLGLKGPAWSVYCLAAGVIGLAKAAVARGEAIRLIFPVLAGRVDRLGKRFIALARAYQAGTLRPPGPPAAGRATAARARDAADAPRAGTRPLSVLPRDRGWLARLLPQHASMFANELRRLLNDPETLQLLAAAPQAGRVLRPLIRMLSADPMPDCLRLPPRPRARSLARPARSRIAADGAPGRRARRAPARSPVPAELRKPIPGRPSWSSPPLPPLPPPPLGIRITGTARSLWPESGRSQYDLHWLPGHLRPRPGWESN